MSDSSDAAEEHAVELADALRDVLARGLGDLHEVRAAYQALENWDRYREDDEPSESTLKEDARNGIDESESTLKEDARNWPRLEDDDTATVAWHGSDGRGETIYNIPTGGLFYALDTLRAAGLQAIAYSRLTSETLGGVKYVDGVLVAYKTESTRGDNQGETNP